MGRGNLAASPATAATPPYPVLGIAADPSNCYKVKLGGVEGRGRIGTFHPFKSSLRARPCQCLNLERVLVLM